MGPKKQKVDVKEQTGSTTFLSKQKVNNGHPLYTLKDGIRNGKLFHIEFISMIGMNSYDRAS